VDVGLAVSAVAGLLNFFVARVLLQAGKQYRSITLEADARHLMTDVITSAAVITGVAAAAITGWQPLDPIIALAVAAQIVLAGARLLRTSALGLMDTALPPAELAAIAQLLANYEQQGVHYHALRTRQSGAQRFMSVHIQVHLA
jgi:cation diffusion facilitator family transporter